VVGDTLADAGRDGAPLCMIGVEPQFRLAFVGPVVPDIPRFHGPAFSRAAVMFLNNLLQSISAAGVRPDKVFSFVPMPAFPRSTRLWCRERSITIGEGLRVSFVPFLNVPILKQITLGLGTAIALLKWGWDTRSTPFRVVYVFNLTTPSGVFVLAAARLIGAAAVVSLNDINEPGQTVPDSLFWRLDYALQRWLIPRFDGHIAVADRIMKDFAPDRRYVRVEGGILPEKFRTAPRIHSNRRGPNEPFVVVAAGSLDEANGVDVLLEAMSSLESPDVRVCIAGDGPLAPLVRQVAARDPRLTYCGYLSFDDVLSLYATADLLVNVRVTKSIQTRYFFPSKLIEYLASGVPVLTTRTGHVEEEFGDAALFLDDETPTGLASRLKEIMSMDRNELQTLGDSARARVLETKTWTAQGGKVAKYLKETVELRFLHNATAP
jgi:glycosyltransferase involved in cell wall biosynthesis